MFHARFRALELKWQKMQHNSKQFDENSDSPSLLTLANNVHKLAGLVYLAEEYCRFYHVTLVPEKSKLLAFPAAHSEQGIRYAELINPISIAGDKIPFVSSAEHVGIVRSTTGGNMPHICCNKLEIVD